MTNSLSCHEIIENLNTALVVMDSSFRVHSLNAAAEILFAMSQRQAINIPFQTLLPGESELFDSLQRVEQTAQALIEHEVKLFLPSVGEIVADCAINLIESNEQTYILLELTQLDLQQSISRGESLHTQQQVLRGLAHEIKNPLGGIRGAAQLLERQLGSAELKEYTKIIISEADRLQNLMTKMLGSYQQTDKTNINIHEVLQRVRQLVDVEVDERLRFEGDYDPSIPELFADFDHLIQIFLNIIRNAVQALNGVGRIILRTRIQRNITIEKKHYRLGLLIEVEDNGSGVPQDLQESLFYPMVTGRAEGTGLGLYIVQNLVQRNAGTVSCSSQAGQTVFSIIFPLELESGS
ncbi:PAS domain-containing sensor histidine kinase [Methylophaga sp. 42_25_T18]|nr:PAS domain-containing sensor histidine kinase [Methylophaga sp. 42_25_T18]OUR87122.1 PAS domain-containing sensor histidine kinase [Methylophaga sp. 42_8_T64]